MARLIGDGHDAGLQGLSWHRIRPQRCRRALAPWSPCRAGSRAAPSGRSPRSKHTRSTIDLAHIPRREAVLLRAPEQKFADMSRGDERCRCRSGLLFLQVQREHSSRLDCGFGIGARGTPASRCCRGIVTDHRHFDLDDLRAQIGHQHVGTVPASRSNRRRPSHHAADRGMQSCRTTSYVSPWRWHATRWPGVVASDIRFFSALQRAMTKGQRVCEPATAGRIQRRRKISPARTSSSSAEPGGAAGPRRRAPSCRDVEHLRTTSGLARARRSCPDT